MTLWLLVLAVVFFGFWRTLGFAVFAGLATVVVAVAAFWLFLAVIHAA